MFNIHGLHPQIPRKFPYCKITDCFRQGILYRISVTSSSDHDVYFSVDLLTDVVFIQHRQVDICCTLGACAYDHTTVSRLTTEGPVQYLDG